MLFAALQGLNAVCYAVFKGRTDIVAELLAHKANVNAATPQVSHCLGV